MDPKIITWIGVAVCLSQSAIFSGLNLAMFGVSRLRLEMERQAGNRKADALIALRGDSNYLLTTILWGNVAANTLLALLSDSLMTGVAAFAFSTFVITIVGEILPQAYFSRNALRLASVLTPFIRFYKKLLYPLAKPSAKLLDKLVGPEGIQYLREQDLRALIHTHIDADEADEVSHFEGLGALNFLALDDTAVSDEGEPIDPKSIIQLPVKIDLPVFPPIKRDRNDAFVKRVNASGKKWIVVVDPDDNPQLVINSDAFLRDLFLGTRDFDPYGHCHRPLTVTDASDHLGKVVRWLTVIPEGPEDDVIDRDVILLWGDERRIITGADLLGRLMRGLVHRSRPH